MALRIGGIGVGYRYAECDDRDRRSPTRTVTAANSPRNKCFPVWFKNSIVVTVFVTAGRVFFDLLAGYALARLRFRGRYVVFAALIAPERGPRVGAAKLPSRTRMSRRQANRLLAPWSILKLRRLTERSLVLRVMVYAALETMR